MTPKTPDPLEKVDLEESQVVSLIPWVEYVGRVIDVSKTSITIEVAHRFSIPISPDALNDSKTLRKGNRVGILVLEDSTVRIRCSSS